LPEYAPSVAAYELEMRETIVGEVAVVELAGELDLTNAPDLERRLERLAADARGLVIDLNRVGFLDSAALHVLFRIGGSMDDQGRAFGIVLAPSAPVAKAVELVQLSEAAHVGPTLENVLVALGS
jgi:anti-anti-sigma factor